jgi:Lipid-droplet associated hydrolase
MAKLVPVGLLAFLYRAWPASQLAVLKDLISSPACISAALVMASDEMKVIKDLDIELLQEFKSKLHFYYASHDDWVGNERDELIKALHPEDLKVVHGEHGIPHAFCISGYSLFLRTVSAHAV